MPSTASVCHVCPRRTGLAQAVGNALGVITASNYATIKQFPTGRDPAWDAVFSVG